MIYSTKKLGEICEIQTGKWDANHATKNGKYRFYTCAKEYANCDTKRFSGECLILPGNGVNVGEVFYYDGDFDAYQRTYVISNITILPKYLYYHLFCYWNIRNANKQFGSATNFLKIGNFLNYEISYPESLLEQRRIMKKLDQVFEKVTETKENMEKNLQNSKELFKSYLQNVFANPGKNWEEKKLGDVLQKTKTVDPAKKPNQEFIYIDVSSVNKETKNIENVTPMKGKDAPSRARKLVKMDDVIFATVRPTHSRVALVTKEYDGQVCSTGYFVLRTTEVLNNKLVYYFLLTSDFNKQMEKLQKGASYPAVTDGEVKNQIISFPRSLSEQKAIVKKLDTLSTETKKLEVIYKQKLADLEELKKSVLAKAFSVGL